MKNLSNDVMGIRKTPQLSILSFLYAVILSLFVALILPSCASVSALDRGCLEDKDMELNASMSDAYGDNVMLYREGASGGRVGKTGGGCGCN